MRYQNSIILTYILEGRAGMEVTLSRAALVELVLSSSGASSVRA